MILADLLVIMEGVTVKIMAQNKNEFLRQGFNIIAYLGLEGYN